MTREQKVAAIQEVADNMGGSVRKDYSGRCMFGKTCYGIVVKGYEMNDCIEQAAAAGIRGARTDSMGLGAIVYWPSIAGD